jgi:hypothetical protein
MSTRAQRRRAGHPLSLLAIIELALKVLTQRQLAPYVPLFLTVDEGGVIEGTVFLDCLGDLSAAGCYGFGRLVGQFRYSDAIFWFLWWFRSGWFGVGRKWPHRSPLTLTWFNNAWIWWFLGKRRAIAGGFPRHDTYKQ